MDPIRRFHRPQLRRPTAVVAFEGWNDACDAASGAVAYLISQFDVEPFAVIEPEEFFDFQARRPHVEVDEGGTRSLTWPDTRFFAVRLPDRDRDVVLVLGEEPNLRWKTYARLVAQVLTDCDVELVVTLGAFIGQVAHTQPVPIVGVATDPEMVVRHDLMRSRYEGPTGIVGVLLEACREAGMPAVSLWAATPHYLAANPNPKAMRALLRRAEGIGQLGVDTAELDEVVSEFEAKVDAAMEASDDLSDYVRRLEGETEIDDASLSADAHSSARLIEDIEEFLRDQS